MKSKLNRAYTGQKQVQSKKKTAKTILNLQLYLILGKR